MAYFHTDLHAMLWLCVQMDQLSEEVMDQLLLRSFVVMYRQRRKLSARAGRATSLTLWSVCQCWRTLIEKHHGQLKALVDRGTAGLHICICLPMCHLSVCLSTL